MLHWKCFPWGPERLLLSDNDLLFLHEWSLAFTIAGHAPIPVVLFGYERCPEKGKQTVSCLVLTSREHFLSVSLVSQSLFECELSAIIKVTVQLAAGSLEEEMYAADKVGECVCVCMCVCTHWGTGAVHPKAIPEGAFPSEGRADRDESFRVPSVCLLF